MTETNKLSIEAAAKIGYEHSMKQMDKVYPETAGMFEWPTENEECRKEWIEKAELMLADTMRELEVTNTSRMMYLRENERLRVALLPALKWLTITRTDDSNGDEVNSALDEIIKPLEALYSCKQ